jgi:hypothetical protein
MPQPPILPPQLGQLRALVAGQAPVAGPGVALGLLHPLAHRGLGQVEVLRDLTHRPVPALAQLNDLRLELSSERTAPQFS